VIDAASGREAIILAGGLGTRLRGVIGDIPKPMAPVAGRPFLTHLFDRLVNQGFSRVILSVGYKHEQIQSHFGDAYGDLRLIYAVEEKPLGTGGGLRHALRHATSSAVFVFNGDTMALVDLAGMHSHHLAAHASLTIALREVPDASRYGCCVINDGYITALSAQGREGAGYINAGVYLMAPSLLERDDLPEAFSFERDFLETHITEARPLAYPFNGQFIDIGVPADYERAQSLFRQPL
jgi:D-glycero-alpha-D-manno-heptose 1-phosphate guanylyltransferase